MPPNKKPKTINPVEVDPSIYFYDEVYDDMKNEDADKQYDSNTSREPKRQESKYITGLLETAEQRKIEKDLRKFKRYARDRTDAEAQGSLNESDVYITTAYKKKLEEIGQIESINKLQRERGKDRVLNIYKNSGSISDTKSDESNKADLSVDKKESTSGQVISPSETTHVKDKDTARSTIKKRLVTYDERKNYLQKVLSKRTINNLFEEAQARYKQRKSINHVELN